MIPCNECICLAICRHKINLICPVLYDFMEVNLSMSRCYEVGMEQHTKQREDIWKQVKYQFRKEDEYVFIDTPSNSTGMYMLENKGRGS